MLYAEALKIVYDIVSIWKEQDMIYGHSKDINDDPVPRIIHIHRNNEYYGSENIHDLVSKIQSVNFADGFPLIYSVILGTESKETLFPTNETLDDKFSSIIPDSLYSYYKQYGFFDFLPNCRGLIMYPQEIDYIIRFIEAAIYCRNWLTRDDGRYHNIIR